MAGITNAGLLILWNSGKYIYLNECFPDESYVVRLFAGRWLCLSLGSRVSSVLDLASVSSHSLSGTESDTMPPPTKIRHLPLSNFILRRFTK